jgi:hypothetical protein
MKYHDLELRKLKHFHIYWLFKHQHASTADFAIGLYEFINKLIVEKIHAYTWKYTNFVFLTKMLIIIWKYFNTNFENLNYLNKNIVSAYFTLEKAEKIGKNEM